MARRESSCLRVLYTHYRKKGSESVDAGEQLLGWMKDMDRMQCSADAGRLHGKLKVSIRRHQVLKAAMFSLLFAKGYEVWYLWLRQTYTMPIREKIAIRGKSSQAMRRISPNFAEYCSSAARADRCIDETALLSVCKC